MSFYGSTPNYAFIWDEAGFEGTTERIRAKQKAGDMAGMAAEITDDHLATFCTEAAWDDLADALIDKYASTIDRLVFYNPAFDTPERFDRYGAIARQISDRTADRNDRSVLIRRAGPTDLDRVVAMNRTFCELDHHPFDEHRVRTAFAPLLADDTHGVVWVTDRPESYAVLTWGWSIEAGGREAVLDEIFVSERGEGYGAALVDHLVADAERRGVARIFLETEVAQRTSPAVLRATWIRGRRLDLDEPGVHRSLVTGQGSPRTRSR